MKTLIKSALLSTAIAGAALTTAHDARATEVFVQCMVSRVGVFDERMHAQCAGDDHWYGIYFAQAGRDFANRTLSLLTAALTAGKPVMFLYDNVETGGWRTIRSVQIFP